MKNEVIEFTTAYERARRKGVTKMDAPTLRPIDFERGREAQSVVSDLYWNGLIDKDVARATSAAIGEATRRHQRWNMRAQEKRPQIKRILKRDGEDCWLCGIGLGKDITREHLIPQSKGGGDEDENIVLCHTRCNQLLGDRPLEEKEAMREAMHQKNSAVRVVRP